VRFSVGFAESDIGGGRALEALSVVVPRREVEKDGILMRTIALTGAS
jgi:hypothetical protein